MQWLADPQSALLPTSRNCFCSPASPISPRRCCWWWRAGFLGRALRRIALVNAAIDAAAIALILYASGGVASGLGILLVLPVGAMAVLADNRDAFLIAALAALGVLVQQTFAYFTDGALGS